MKVDPRFVVEDGPEVFTGNELLIKGALESEGGVHLLGGYPGSPIAGFFDCLPTIKDLLVEKGIRAVINNNEALAAAMLNGTQGLPCRAIIAMKSVGVHVAADALALGNLAGAHKEGGAIVIYGDDPWSDSTQVASDSRFISKHLFIPTIEPSNQQEVKDFVDLAFKLSRAAELYAGFVITTNLADGGGTVMCRPNHYPVLNTNNKVTLETAKIDLNTRVLLPPKTWWQEASLGQRFARAMSAARTLGLNRIINAASARAGVRGDGQKPIGFVTSGLAHGYLVQALGEMGLEGQFPILKLGLSYPVDPQMVRLMAEQCSRLVVVEERRSFIEEQVNEIILKDRQAGAVSGQTEVWGKVFPDDLAPIPDTRGLHPSILIERLAPLLKFIGAAGGNGKGRPGVAPMPMPDLDREVQTIRSTELPEVGTLPARSATFCPGCPHRDSASLCLEIKKRFMDAPYMQRVHGREPMDLVFHGDTGCYTMLMYAPNTPLMHDYSGMGLGGGTGSGTDPFITNKEVVFMGDSTFFASGQIAISQAVKLGQDITFIILDNSTTAMTGHQPTPGVEYDIIGNPTPTQNIEDIVTAMAGTSGLSVVRVDPEKRGDYAQLLERTFLAGGVKVVIADKECGITRTRRKRRAERAVIRQRGYLPVWEHMNVNQDICRFCLACSELTGCPGLKHTMTEHGLKMDTDITACVDDGACERIGACSSFERVAIKRKRPPKSKVPELDLGNIPEPQKRPMGQQWNCCLVGVGGMGIGLATSIVVRAGHKEGHKVTFLDKKGLAIRNGGVVSQVIYAADKAPATGIIPYGKADLLLGVDILEATRCLDPRGRMRIASADRTAAVINTDKVRTIRGLMGQEDFDTDKLEKVIRQYTRGSDYMARNISRICEKYLGSKLYANIMMLGFAFQKGHIPVSMHSMAWAIKDTIRTDFRKNLYAFNMGRKLVEKPDLFLGASPRSDWRAVLEEKCRYAMRRHRSQKICDELRELAATTIDAMAAVDDELKRAVVVRIYDCLRWGGVGYARRYADRVLLVYRKETGADEQTPRHGDAETRREEDAKTRRQGDRETGSGEDTQARRTTSPVSISASPGLSVSVSSCPATRAVIYNLAKAMLIKDAVFLAELSTSPEKYARDREKYNINHANGDRLRYRHMWHLETRFAGVTRRLDVVTYDWMLKILRRTRWLRRFDAAYKPASDFLRLYDSRIDKFLASPAGDWQHALTALSSPQCMSCMVPRCRETGCPLQSLVPQWVQLSYEGRWKEAADLLHSTNNFPEITARICPAFCQGQCKQAIAGSPGHTANFGVQVRDIEFQIAQKAMEQGWLAPQRAAARTGKKVAIIGSGPAGLAAAQQLARAGHDVTVYERDPLPGGLLQYGIPGFRLPKDLVAARVKQLREEGVTFKCGLDVGGTFPAAELRDQYDAILLATGATKPRDLDVPGRDASNVHFAIDYLRQGSTTGTQTRRRGDTETRREDNQTSKDTPQSSIANRQSSIRNPQSIVVKDKAVAVIGGGLTGEDCVELALRQGARQVVQLEILPQSAAGEVGATGVGAASESPRSDAEPSAPQPLTRHFCVTTKRFLVQDGAATQLEAAKVQWISAGNGQGPSEIPGTRFATKVDLVLLAMGFEPVVPEGLARQLGLAVDGRGRPAITNYAAGASGRLAGAGEKVGAAVFATGDLVTGPSYVAKAINAGREAAQKINECLTRNPSVAGENEPEA
jgi:indolepyruvate ferredoxin oxidoreductase